MDRVSVRFCLEMQNELTKDEQLRIYILSHHCKLSFDKKCYEIVRNKQESKNTQRENIYNHEYINNSNQTNKQNILRKQIKMQQ